MSTILQPRKKELSVVGKDSSDQTLFSGLQELSNLADVKPDMRPDVIICSNCYGCTFPIAVVQVISAGKTKLDAFYRASTYAMVMARLYAHFGIEHPGCCIVFPNPRTDDLFGISIVTCQWDYELCHFSFTAKSINCVLEEINDSILSVLPSRKDCRSAAERFINGGFEHVSKFIFKLRLDACFGDQYEAVEQLSSSHAIVLKVKQRDTAKELVIKVVDNAVYGKLTKFKDLHRLKSPYLVHHDSTVQLFPRNQECIAITFPYLLPPLTTEEAGRCLKDFNQQSSSKYSSRKFSPW